MNERIRELALQSKLRPALLLHHYGTIDAMTDTEQQELRQIEKFAELLISESCAALWTEECHTSDLAFEEVKRNEARIKQHFGIDPDKITIEMLDRTIAWCEQQRAEKN